MVKLVLALHQILQNLSLTNPAILRHLPVTSLTAGMVILHKVCLAQVTGAIFAPVSHIFMLFTAKGRRVLT
jgi:hypothetical protein